MTGLVLDLQKDALDKNVSVSDLLRKALVICKKLNIVEIQQWINWELNGYPSDNELIPDYREVQGEPKIYNPYHGWQPINFEDPQMAKELSTRKNNQAIGGLVSMMARGEKGTLVMPYPQDIVNYLQKGMDIPLQPSLMIPHSAIIDILEAVRNKILDWTLELESQGILGEGLHFSDEEKHTAQVTNYQITNHIGTMHNSQLQVDSPNATQNLTVNNDLTQLTSFIETLKAELAGLPLKEVEKEEMNAEIATIESQIASPKPKNVIVKESLKTLRSLLEGVTGSVIASGLLAQLAIFM